MVAIQVAIRDGAYDQVNTDMAGYVITDLDLEKTYFPQENLEDLVAKPKVKFVSIGIASNRDRQFRSTAPAELLVPVQVAIQQKVDPTDTTTIDTLVELIEEIILSLEDDELVAAGTNGETYSWSSSVPLKDENDLVYSYEQLTVQGVFQSIYTINYNYVKQ